VASGGSLSLTGAISDLGDGSAPGLTFDGPGTLSFDGSGANTYTGPTTVNGGTLALNRSALTIPGPLTIGNGTAPATVIARGSYAIARDADVTVNAGTGSATNAGVLNVQAVTPIGSLSGGGVVQGSNLYITGSKSTTFSGTFQNFGDVYKTGPSNLTLTGSGNRFVMFNLIGGTLTIGSDGALGNATLDLNSTVGVTGGTGTGSVTLQATAPRATGNSVLARGTVVFAGTAPTTFGSLILTDNTTLDVTADTTFGQVSLQSGAGALTKSGPGTLTIGVPGSPNTYGGPTVVNGGTLKLANGGIGDQTTGYTVNNAVIDFSAGGTNAALAASLTGSSATVLGSLTVGAAAISGTNLTLGDLKIAPLTRPALTGTLTVGNLVYTDYGLPNQTIPAGTVIGGTGTVTVETNGGLIVNGQVDKPFSVTGELWGRGTINGPVDVLKVRNHSAIIGAGTPEAPDGTFTVGGLTLETGATLWSGIRSTNATTINVNGDVTLAGALYLYLQAVPGTDAAFVILNNDGTDPVNGGFSNLPNDGDTLTKHSTGVDYVFTVNYHYDAAGDGADNDVALTVSIVPTPEPSTAVVLVGLASALTLGRRPRRRVTPTSRAGSRSPSR
jgi:autotransporter-associated beta strand protein